MSNGRREDHRGDLLRRSTLLHEMSQQLRAESEALRATTRETLEQTKQLLASLRANLPQNQDHTPC
jgi:hypothetical protein